MISELYVVDNDLTSLRAKIRQLDEQLLAIVARRQMLAREIGEFKSAHNLPIVEEEIEHEIISSRRSHANQLGLDENSAEEIIRTLITLSRRLQAQCRKSKNKGS